MTAKQTLVPLFVRIPLSLKQRVRFSSTANGGSMSREVARLLKEQLHSSLPADFKVRFLQLQASLYKNQLEAMEALVLACIANSEAAAGSKQLRLLGEKVLEMQHQREKTAQEIQRRREEQQEFLARPKQRADGPFAPLFYSNNANDLPQRLEKWERRRINLIQELKSRPRGTQARIAASLRCTPGYISQMLSEPSSAGHRRINEKVARTIEAALELGSAALDLQDPRSGTVAIQRVTEDLGKALKKRRR